MNTLMRMKPVDNQAIVEEEELGFAGDLLPQRLTSLNEDFGLRQRIERMSALEIIS